MIILIQVLIPIIFIRKNDITCLLLSIKSNIKCSYPNKDDATRCINCGMELNTYWDKSGDRPRLVDEWKK